MRISMFCAVAALAVISFNSAARGQATIKAGLWQSDITSSTTMALPPEAEARIAAMPPAQQAQVRAMMGGMGGKPVSTSTKSCFASSMNLDSFLSQQRNGPMTCTFTNKVQSADGASFDTSCTSAQGTANGHTQIHLVDSDHATTSMHMTIDAAQQGHTVHMTIESSGSTRYLGADCGDVKPYTPGAH